MNKEKSFNLKNYYDSKRSQEIEEMRIYIKTIIGETFTLIVSETETVENLKSKIREITGVPTWKQMLIYACKMLEENTILSDYDIQNDESIHLIIRYNACKIYIKTLNDKTIDLEYDQMETIGSIKNKIEKKEKIMAGKQILIYDAKKLEDNKTILDYGINKESMITLIVMDDHEKLNEELKKQINNLKNDISERNIKIEQMEKIIKELKKKYEEEKRLNDDLEKNIRNLKDEKIKIEKKLENLNDENKKNKKTIEKMGKKLYSIDDFLELKEYFENKLNKSIQKIENLLSVIFISNENGIYWSINCNENDKFSTLVDSFYDKYPEFKELDNYYYFNGNNIKKEKSLKEIGIKHNDIIFIKEK